MISINEKCLRHVLSYRNRALLFRKISFTSHQRCVAANYRVFSTLKMYSVIDRGAPFTNDYRLFIRDEHGPISPFHDIPLFADSTNKIFNMVVEIPRWSNAKMEIATAEPLNPIKQDIKKGNLRFVSNVFPHHGYIWNYGALPQTWENPQNLDEATGCKGDNDPIDALEIGSRVAKRGDVLQVKVLGIMGLIDEGETDWKVVTIDTKDPMASKVNDIQDVEEFYPGLLKATHEWFKIYKVPQGSAPNQFAFNGEAKNKEFALKVVEETHRTWETLIKTQADDCPLSRKSITVDDSPFKISREDAQEIVKNAAEPGPAAPIDPIVDKWFFIQLK